MDDAPEVRYRRLRARSRQLFELLTDDAYYSQPIALRHPVVFYDGHLPGFAFNTLVRDALGGPSIDRRLETLFARGIDPHESSRGDTAPGAAWPSRDQVRRFVEEAERRVAHAMSSVDPGNDRLQEAVGTILEHEALHQETLLYLWHRLPLAQKRKPAGYAGAGADGSPAPSDWVEVPAGWATLGAARESIPFGWDNEFPELRTNVGPFLIERHDVTNVRFLEFVDAGGYRDERWWRPEDWEWVRTSGVSHPLFWERGASGWMWRAQFELVPLPLSWPVYVSQAEASAYARWKGARLPSEAEYHRAAFGSPDGERRFPWGEDTPAARHGVFGFERWDPAPAGARPEGMSAWGVHDLMGNGWEWTSTPFGPFPGFTPMRSYPQYSADFFDREHFVMKGASPVTAHELLRRSFRNWFRARYPYVYAAFRCVKDTHPVRHD